MFYAKYTKFLAFQAARTLFWISGQFFTSVEDEDSGAAASYISSIFARGGLMGSNLLYLSIEEILAPLLLKNAIKTPKKQKLSLMKLINEEFALLIR